MWTLFWDMHSGGGCKESPFEKIFIEAPEDEAKVIFYNRFGHNPERVTCTCCGEDYSVSESETFELASAYHRDCKFDRKANEYLPETGKMTVAEYQAREDVLVLAAGDIEPEWRQGEVPEQGYVWMD